MIQEELRKFIEQNCSGKEPSDLIMEAIGQKIEQMGADADEVLAFVEECTKGPTLEQKVEAVRRAAEAEAERQARIAEAEAKAKSDAKNAELAAEKAKKAMAEAEAARQKADEAKAKLQAEKDARIAKRNKRTTVYLKVMTRKSAAQLASEAAYNTVNSESIDDIEVSTADVPSDDPSIVIDPNGDVKAQLEQHYETVMDLNSGFYKLKDHGKYGLADASGKIIQRPKYDEILFKNQNGLIRVKKDEKIGFLNLKGIEVLAPKYSNIEEPSEGLIKVKADGLFGFLDANTLKEVTPCVYTYIYEKRDGKYRAMKGNQEFCLNEDGTLNY